MLSSDNGKTSKIAKQIISLLKLDAFFHLQSRNTPWNLEVKGLGHTQMTQKACRVRPEQEHHVLV